MKQPILIEEPYDSVYDRVKVTLPFKQTKINLLLHWLRAGHSISNKESVDMWNYYRLADGIFVLRKKYDIKTTRVNIGKDISFARYSMAS